MATHSPPNETTSTTTTSNGQPIEKHVPSAAPNIADVVREKSPFRTYPSDDGTVLTSARSHSPRLGRSSSPSHSQLPPSSNTETVSHPQGFPFHDRTGFPFGERRSQQLVPLTS
jgi:hypothetical protein